MSLRCRHLLDEMTADVLLQARLCLSREILRRMTSTACLVYLAALALTKEAAKTFRCQIC